MWSAPVLWYDYINFASGKLKKTPSGICAFRFSVEEGAFPDGKITGKELV